VNTDWCQRWRGGEHTWRHRSEGGFDPTPYTVEVVAEAVAKSYVLANHYSGTFPASSRRIGLFRGDDLVGVAVLGIPVQAAVLSGTFPDLEPYVESLELSRFVLDDECPANSESWFLARCFDELAPTGLRGVVAFSDPVPRRLGDRVLFPGHVGTIYQASNATYCGRGRARILTIVPQAGGVVLNDRSMAKVRSGDRGHDHVERRLVDWGARPLREGEARDRWLVEALDAVGAQRLRHSGNHRYAFRLGSTARARRAVRIGHPPSIYPKSTDPSQGDLLRSAVVESATLVL
jgi:hypothetical protein